MMLAMTKRGGSSRGQRIEPTPERIARAKADGAVPLPDRTMLGGIDEPGRAIKDTLGRPGNPYRVIDTIAAMEARRTITAAMSLAAAEFRTDFCAAQLEALRAMPMEYIGRARDERFGIQRLPDHIIGARDRVAAAIKLLGGIAAPAGSCAWHVLGEEMTLRDWCAMHLFGRGRPLSPEAASGVLIGALGALALHYGIDNPD